MILFGAFFLYLTSTFICSEILALTVVTKIMALFLGVIYFLDTLIRRKPLIQLSLYHVIFVIWVFTAVTSGLLSGSPAGNMDRAITIALVLGVSVVLYGALLHSGSLTAFSWAFILAISITSLGSSVGILPNISAVSGSTRFSATFANANAYGFVCVMGIVFSFYLFQAHRPILIKGCVLLFPVYLFIMCLHTGSRKAIVGIAMISLIEYGMLSAFLIQKKKGLGIMIIGLVSLLLVPGILGFGYLVMSGEHGSRFRNIGHFIKGEKMEKGEKSLDHRLLLYEAGWRLFMQNPAFGSGLASFRETGIKTEGMVTKGIYSHSNYVEVLVSSGLVGFLTYYGMYGGLTLWLLFFFKRHKQCLFTPNANFVLMVLPYLLFYDFFAVTYYTKNFWVVFTALLGAVGLLKTQAQSFQKSGASIEKHPKIKNEMDRFHLGAILF